MKTIDLNPLLSLLELDGVIVVKNIEPLENCTVTIRDILLEPPVTVLRSPLLIESVFDAEKLVEIVFHQWGKSLRSAAEEINKMNEVLRDRPEPKRKNHPQPCNPKSFRRKTNR
tara:strand:- start:1337 stop:1678 length:342 start_codon:yes stop_codon:yes gene_type:complete